MATQRYISTSFWDDPWVTSLELEEKYLYLYLLTNPLTNIAGVYQIALRRIIFDTLMDKDSVLSALDTFAKNGKAHYVDGYIIIPNWPKHQKITERDNNRKGIDAILMDLPDVIFSNLVTYKYRYRYLKGLFERRKGLEDPYKPLTREPNYSDLDTDLDSDLEREADSNRLDPPQPEEDDIPFAPLPNHTLAIDWYRVYHSKTGKLIQPSEKDYKAASDLLKRTDIKTAQTLIPGYFDCDQWWMKSKGSEKIVYSFQGFCRNFTELLSLQPQPRGRPSVGTCPDCGTVHLGAKTCPRCGKELTYAS